MGPRMKSEVESEVESEKESEEEEVEKIDSGGRFGDENSPFGLRQNDMLTVSQRICI